MDQVESDRKAVQEWLEWRLDHSLPLPRLELERRRISAMPLTDERAVASMAFFDRYLPLLAEEQH